MAEQGGRELFRKKSLERLSSPERLDHLLEVVDRKSWIPLGTIAVLVAGILFWAVFARIPVNVEGRGILVRPRKIVEFQSAGRGRVAALEVSVDSTVRRGELLARIERPDLEEQLRLHKMKAAQLTAQSRVAGDTFGGVEPGEAAAQLSGPSLRDHIDRTRAAAERLRRERLEAIEEEKRRIDAQEQVARQLSESLRERVRGQKKLREQNLISLNDLDATEEEYMDSLQRLYDIESQRGALQTARLEAEELFFDRAQKVAEWTFRLEQEIAEVDREIATLQMQIAEESRVLADHDGRVIEIITAQGRLVDSGERLGALEVSDASTELSSVTYFSVRDGKRLEVGNVIHVTPDTHERERFGSIRGEVRSVSSFPVSVDEAARVVGNRGVAETLTAGGYLIEVHADLLPSPEHPGRYDWTSSRGPREVEVTSGTTTTARIAVERERPIAFVLPLLKSATGLD